MESVFAHLHPNLSQLMVLTLAQEPPIVTNQHPTPVELEARSANCRQVGLDPSARLDRVDDEFADPNQPGSSEYLSTAPAAVVRAG